MPASDRGEGIASKTMHRAHMWSVMAVKILNPKMAACLLDEFEFGPQQACVAAKALGPDALARPFMEPQRCQHCARRTPHEFAGGIVAIGIDGRSQAGGDGRNDIHYRLDKKNAGIAGK